jgi:quercetin dioxygenase-like cupin family protein
MGFTVVRLDQVEFDAPSGGDRRRGIVRLSDSMKHMRGNIWRLPAGSRGRRHAERIQEEIFVVLDGTATMLLGDPPERVELPQGSLVVVEPGTALQVRNESTDEVMVLILGAPPETGEADYLPDVD